MIKLLNEIVTQDNNTIIRLFDTNYAGEKEIEIVEKDRKQNIRFRNVGDRNKDCAIQFSMEEYNKVTNRTKHFGFSVPLEMVAAFLEHLSTIREPQK